MDYDLMTIDAINKLSLLASIETISWKTLDQHIRGALHYARLYLTFSDETQYYMWLWRICIIEKINSFIIIRNSKLKLQDSWSSTTKGINSIEKNKQHGPLGIILHLFTIRNSCITKIKPICNNCKSFISKLIESDMGDIHAFWKCPSCESTFISFDFS